jgi:hypothetical protein
MTTLVSSWSKIWTCEKKHVNYIEFVEIPYSIYFKIIISHIKVSPVSPGPTGSSGSCQISESIGFSVKKSANIITYNNLHA